jgi:hypothetical protein
MMKRLLLSTFGVLLCTAVSARADIVYDFSKYLDGSNNTVTNPGNATYTLSPSLSDVTFVPTSGSPAVQLPASGFLGTEASNGTFTGLAPGNNLFFKNAGVSETGLGIANSPDNEISFKTGSSDIVRLNLSNLVPNFSSATVTIQSVQALEGFELFKSASATDPGSPFLTVNGGLTDTVSVSVSGSTPYLWIAATPVAFSNVLLDTIDVSVVPEPASLSLFAIGLGGLGFCGWYRRRLV